MAGVSALAAQQPESQEVSFCVRLAVANAPALVSAPGLEVRFGSDYVVVKRTFDMAIDLITAARDGIPLLEITVQFVEGVDSERATALFNALGEDIHLHPQPWYGRDDLRVGSATAKALYRLFGWRVERVPLVLRNGQTGQFEETEFFRWEDIEPWRVLPDTVSDVVLSMSYSQPGPDDDGQWYEPRYA